MFRVLQKLVEADATVLVSDVPKQPARNEQRNKSVQIGMSFDKRPIKPSGLVIVAVSIVISALSAAHLVAHLDHGHSHGKECRRQEILDLAISQALYGRIIAGALHA